MTEIDAEEMEELVAEVREIRDNTVGAKSRVIYWNSSARFVHWLYQNKRYLLNPEFLNALGQDGKGS